MDFWAESKRVFPFLPRSQAAAAYLALIEGLSNEEIASRLGLSSADSAAILIHRATKQMPSRSSRQALARILFLGTENIGMSDMKDKLVSA